MQLLSPDDAGNERTDGSRRYRVGGRHTICIFCFRRPPTAPSSSYPNIMALRGAFSMQFARKNTGAAEDTARKIGKRMGDSSLSGVPPHFPISFFSVSSEYYFSFFLVDAGIKKQLQNRRSCRSGMNFLSSD